MKFKLVEMLEQHFNEFLELEYEASEVADEEDESKVQGSITITVSPSEFSEAIWNIMIQDKKHPVLTDTEFEQLSEDNEAYEKFLKDNFEMLVEKYDEELHTEFKDVAHEKLDNKWDDYSDEDQFSQKSEDEREFWRNVW